MATPFEDLTRAHDLHAQAMELLDLNALDEAERCLREALVVYERLGLIEERANTLHELGILAFKRDQLDVARRLVREARAVYGPSEAWRLANSDAMLAVIEMKAGNLDEAERMLRDVLTVYQSSGDEEGKLRARKSLETLRLLRKRLGRP